METRRLGPLLDPSFGRQYGAHSKRDNLVLLFITGQLMARDGNRLISLYSHQNAVLETQTKMTYSRLSYGNCRLGMPSARITRDVFLGDSIAALGT